ncbi:L-threonylcarbamoyladenylate synthase, partial [Pseudomonas aeruginosa]
MISSFRAQCAARVVREGGVIAYPTEAVWGLGCDPWNEDAVYRLLALKARPVEKGLIVVAANIHQLDFLLEDLPDVWLDRLAGTWPGPNTWLVPHQERLPEWVTGVHDSVAVRVTDHPLVQELCHLTGPLISTSANPAG